MRIQRHRHSRSGRVHLGVVSLLALVLLAGLGWLSLPHYRQWKQHRFQTQARDFLAKTNLPAAFFSGQQALVLNSSNLETLRLLGDISATAHQPQAIGFRRRVAELEPGNPTNRLLWAQTALAFEPPPFAETIKALEGISEPARHTPEFHFISAALELKRNQREKAEEHFQAALDLAPTNRQAEINLAVLRLQSTNAPQRAAAQQTLDQMRSNPEARLSVLRSLAAYCGQTGQLPKALEYSKELLGEKEATLGDKLAHAELLKKAGARDFEAFLSKLQSEAAGQAQVVATLVGWMRGNDLARPALSWVQSLPKAMQDELPVPMAVSDLYAASQDWAGLQAFLRDQSWGDREFTRHAILAFALRNGGDRESSELRWHRAVRATDNQPHLLGTLAQMAGAWGWNAEAEQVLLTIVTQHPGEKWASQTLLPAYFAAGNTEGLRKIFAALADAEPQDFAMRNNLAVTSFLLNHDVAHAHQLARAVYTHDQKNPDFIATYAYSLHLQGKSPEALALFQTVEAPHLSEPSTAVYYGLVLAAVGEKEKAIQALEIGEKKSPLPEERKLATDALGKLRRP